MLPVWGGNAWWDGSHQVTWCEKDVTMQVEPKLSATRDSSMRITVNLQKDGSCIMNLLKCWTKEAKQQDRGD